ncbi:fasciclin-like arabinogalactan protein 3 [Impatiens glandulifera]|uniref:fasciclin-like arabinogalactan protein 3 n=1 Tax=Impatiens glandulifera TaxID=253017 RepID=UPI001FB0CF13|nr:fasciclin-like arabinogalactan protein 3 [Impatiens glandulifera]
MDIKNYFIFSLFFICCSADNFNITELLGQYPELSVFNNYLTQTQLADDINSRQIVTVLAVDNDGISSISGKSDEILRKIMAVHVLLEYYDIIKLRMMPGCNIQTTTLFQNSGQAIGKQGFMNLTVTLGGALFFGSSAGGSGSTDFVKAIMSRPYNISVMQIRDVIIPDDIDIDTMLSPPPPYSMAPAPEPTIEAPSPGVWSSGPAPVEGSSGPAPVEGSSGPAPVEGSSGPAPVEGSSGPAPVESDDAPGLAPEGFFDAPGPDGSDDAPNPIGSGHAPVEAPTPFAWSPEGEDEQVPAKISKDPPSLVIASGPGPGSTIDGSGSEAVSVRFGIVVMMVALCTWLTM